MKIDFKCYYDEILDNVIVEQYIDTKLKATEVYEKVSQAKDAALMAALPAEALRSLYRSVITEMSRRSLDP